MKKFILYIFLLCCSINRKKEIQEVKLPKRQIDNNNLIGFACFYSGEKSKSVEIFTKLLIDKKYAIIKEKLKSESIAEKYLATVACKKLAQKKLIQLNNLEQNQINNNMISTETIAICSGCTNYEKMSLKEMFTSNNYLSDNVEKWLTELIK